MKHLIALFLSIILLFSYKNAIGQTIAVLDFRNNGSNEYDYLQAGISDIFSSNLAKSRDIKVVERRQLSKIITELKLNVNDLFDVQTAAEVGKISGAQYVIIGTYMNLGAALRFDVKAVETATGIVFPGGSASAKAEHVESVDLVMDNLAGDLIKKIIQERERDQKASLVLEHTHPENIAIAINGSLVYPTKESYSTIVKLKLGVHELTAYNRKLNKRRLEYDYKLVNRSFYEVTSTEMIHGKYDKTKNRFLITVTNQSIELDPK